MARNPFETPQNLAGPSGPTRADNEWNAPVAGHRNVEVREVLERFLRYKWWIVACVVVSLLVAASSVRFRDPTYSARALVRIHNYTGSLGGNLTGTVPWQWASADAVHSHMEIVRSSDVLGVAVDRVGLRLESATRGFWASGLDRVYVPPETPEGTISLDFSETGYQASGWGQVESAPYGQPVELNGVRFAVAYFPEIPSAELWVVHRDRAIRALRDAIQLIPIQGTNVLEVRYSSHNPEHAARVVNATVEAYLERDVRGRRELAQKQREFLEEQVRKWEAMAREAQQALADFRAREGIFSSREVLAAQQAGIMSLEAQREELRATRQMYQTMLDRMREAEPGSVGRHIEVIVASPEIASNPVIQSLFAQLTDHERERDNLVSGPWGTSRTNPDVIRLEEQIASTIQRMESAVSSHMEFLDARVNAITEILNRTSTDLAQLPAVEAEEARLLMEVEFIQGAAEQMRAEYNAAQIAENALLGDAEALEFATPPLDPDPVSAQRRLIVALLLGLIIGMTGAFLADTFNTRVRRIEEVEEMVDAPYIGIVPPLTVHGRVPGVSLVRRLLGGKGHLPKGAEAMALNGVNPAGEAFRTIRTNLLFSDSVREVKTLVVTSPAPGEGKTTSAVNLAAAYAQQDKRVLLVDCDLRKSRIHTVFGVPREPGLTELLLGTAAWQDVCHEVGVEGVHFIPSGMRPPNPSELLGGPRMRKILELFARAYDIVIFDTPPLVAGADAAVLGAACDGTVLIVRLGVTDRSGLQYSVRQLYHVGARLLGVVMNDPSGELANQRRYYYYYNYKYQYS